MKEVWQKTLGEEIQTPFANAFRRSDEPFGSDKPDMRFGLEIVDFSEDFRNSDFKVFAEPSRREEQSRLSTPRDLQTSHKANSSTLKKPPSLLVRKVSPSSNPKTENGSLLSLSFSPIPSGKSFGQNCPSKTGTSFSLPPDLGKAHAIFSDARALKPLPCWKNAVQNYAIPKIGNFYGSLIFLS